jgi:hypothetical protein
MKTTKKIATHHQGFLCGIASIVGIFGRPSNALRTLPPRTFADDWTMIGHDFRIAFSGYNRTVCE